MSLPEALLLALPKTKGGWLVGQEQSADRVLPGGREWDGNQEPEC